MIDFHCHSHFSDGIHTPQMLIDKALHANLQWLALTDHDTVEGNRILNQLEKNSSLTIINGIELSVRWRTKDIHILGLGIDIDNDHLLSIIERQQQSRQIRGFEISEKLARLGLENAYDKACKLAGHTQIGRPHFAKVMVEEGFAKDMAAAFKRFLARGRPAYTETKWIDLTTAVDTITQAGGHAVIAHPVKYKLTRTKLIELTTQFKAAGGEGLEVVSGETSDTDISTLLYLARQFDLSVSSGSDFHGDNISRIGLGKQKQLPLNCKPIWHQWKS